MSGNYEVVYSTDPAWCAKCRRSPCTCKPTAAAPAGAKQTAKLRLEKRRGKAVTVVFNLTLGEDALKILLRDLQKACGTGGTVKDGGIEIQGDLRDRIEAALVARGMKVKRAGG